MQSNFLAVLFALTSSLTIAWGTVIKHRIAESAPDDGKGKKSPFINALLTPLWWLGTITALAGYAFQAVALAFGALLIVQPIIVLALMFSLPLSAYFDGRRTTVSGTVWSFILTSSVAVLVILGRPLPGNPHPAMNKWLISLGIGAVLVAAMCHFSEKFIRREKALILGVASGVVFGYVAVLSKAVVDLFVNHGITTLMLSWEIYSLIIGAILGTVIQQYSFNAGALKTSLPAMTITEPVVAFILSYAILGEKFQVSGWGWAAMALALVAMLASTVALSREGVD